MTLLDGSGPIDPFAAASNPRRKPRAGFTAVGTPKFTLTVSAWEEVAAPPEMSVTIPPQLTLQARTRRRHLDTIKAGRFRMRPSVMDSG